MIEFRHNPSNITSISSFGNIKSKLNSNVKDIYFVRATGVNSSLANDIEKLDIALTNDFNVVYKRISSLPNLSMADDVQFYTNCYEKWLESGRTSIHTRIIGSKLPENILNRAFSTVFEIFKNSKLSITPSIEKNFAIKTLYRFDMICEDFLNKWNEELSIKIAAENVGKRQEYLFFYMLTLIGADVLLIQSRTDADVSETELKLSSKFVLGNFGECKLPEFNANLYKQSVPQNSIQPVKIVIPERTRMKKSASTPVAPQITDYPVQRREKSFEELARLASSIVMIAACDSNGNILGTGSGIMIGREGYILTNYHVIRGGVIYSVRIEDDENLYNTNEIIKYHPLFDLAVIRIQRMLDPVPVYRESQKLMRGQKVVAIGSPMGLFNSVSDGIISGFRTISDMDMIQFTAPISHGSSGGAVLNMFGEVIGIITAGIDEGQNLNLAMSYEYINNFIRGFL